MVRPPRRHLRITRDLALFLGGFAGGTYEVVTVVSSHSHADPTLLAFFGGMLGLPLYLRRDEKQPPPPPAIPSSSSDADAPPSA